MPWAFAYSQPWLMQRAIIENDLKKLNTTHKEKNHTHKLCILHQYEINPDMKVNRLGDILISRSRIPLKNRLDKKGGIYKFSRMERA